jgi:hypothetical protein
MLQPIAILVPLMVDVEDPIFWREPEEIFAI